MEKQVYELRILLLQLLFDTHTYTQQKTKQPIDSKENKTRMNAVKKNVN